MTGTTGERSDPTDAAPRRPSQGRRYLTALDGLRAIAAIGVIIIHTESEKGVAISTYIYTGAIAGPFFLLFFAISGFVLYRGWARKHLAMRAPRSSAPRTSADGGADGGVLRFFARRLLRIYPLYWVVATAALLVHDPGKHLVATDYLQVYLISPWPHPDALLSSGLGIVVWTLLIDVVFYLYIAAHGAAVSAILRRTRIDPVRFEVWTLLGMAAAFPFLQLVVHAPWVALSCLPLGMLYAVVDAWQNQEQRRHRAVAVLVRYWWVPLTIFVVGVAIGAPLVAAAKPKDYGTLLVDYLWIQLVLVSFGLLFLACIIWGPTRWAVNRFLSSKAMVTVGTLTYGTYLWHEVVLKLLRRDYAPEVGLWGALAITLVGSVLLSTITYQLIERPLAQQRQRLRTDGPAVGPGAGTTAARPPGRRPPGGRPPGDGPDRPAGDHRPKPAGPRRR